MKTKVIDWVVKNRQRLPVLKLMDTRTFAELERDVKREQDGKTQSR